MDLVSNCKDKLANFRIKELKDVLSQLGLAKQGKKQDLVDRILAVLSDDHVSKSHGRGKKDSIGKEEVAKIIDDTYRKMKVPGATDLASKSHSGSDLNYVKPKDEVVDPYLLNTKVRCPCASSLIIESMIKCEDPLCQVSQHFGCVIIPEKPLDGFPPEIPAHFYCEICRIKRADPFLVTVDHPLLPLKFTSSGTAADGTTSVQNIERTFQLTRADRDLLQKSEYDLLVWCILQNDKVPFRMQWPLHADLHVNGVSVQITNRPGSQLLGINGRDNGPAITTCSREGINKICFTWRDDRVFCFGIRVAKRRTLQQVLSLVPKEADGESLEDALTRVRRCIGGESTTENADDDSDLEMVSDSVSFNLRCPMSGSRIRVAGRFRPCAHMGCFDLEAFVELNQRSRKWQCPICLKNYSVENIIIDSYFNRITSLMRNCSEDVNEVDIKPDASWRVKNEVEIRELARWHSPDGSLYPISDADVKPGSGVLGQIKQEDAASEGHTGLRLGMKRKSNGIWELNKPERFGNHCLNAIPMSSSATGSYREGEDPSVNQGGLDFDFSLNNGHMQDSFSPNFDPTNNVPSRDADVVVLTDSEEDLVTMISPEAVYDTGPAGGTLSLFDNNGDDFGPIWPMQSEPVFQLFQNSDALVAPVRGFGFALDGGLGEGPQVQNIPTCSNTETNGGLVDNPFGFGVDDPSLQIFLPTRSPGLPIQPDLGEHTGTRSNDEADDWISLSLSAGGNHGDFTLTNGMTTKRQSPSNENGMKTLTDTASLFQSMNNDRSKIAPPNSRRFESAFSHPRQPRSVRPRPFLSIDADSD